MARSAGLIFVQSRVPNTYSAAVASEGCVDSGGELRGAEGSRSQTLDGHNAKRDERVRRYGANFTVRTSMILRSYWYALFEKE